MKTCTRCKKKKNLLNFYKRSRNLKDGHTGWCKLCILVTTRKYHKINRESRNAYSRKYRAANREVIKAKNKKYRAENRVEIKASRRKYYVKNCEEIKGKNKKYQEENIDKVKESTAQRRAREHNAFVAPVDRQKIFIRDSGKCHICKEFVDPSNWHLDHILPLSRGGTHEPKNVAVSHPKCNLQKNAYGAAQLRLIN